MCLEALLNAPFMLEPLGLIASLSACETISSNIVQIQPRLKSTTKPSGPRRKVGLGNTYENR